MYVIVCLGVEPLAIGPFMFVDDADSEIELHTKDGVCPNGITKEEHHTLDMKSGYFTEVDDSAWDDE